MVVLREGEGEDDIILVEPRGNLLLVGADSPGYLQPKFGLGPLLEALGGVESINEKLLPLLDVRDLCVLSSCSRLLYMLIAADDTLWRELAIATLSDDELQERLIKWSSWRSVATGHLYAKRRLGRVFSDALHRPLQCARAAIDPSWLVVDNVARESHIDVPTFVEKYEIPKLPVVLTGFGNDFAQGIARWKYGLTEGMKLITKGIKGKPALFRCGARSISPEAFAAYSTSRLALSDESPLYIFDARFGEKYPEMAQDYTVPSVFKGPGRDLFEHLGPERRPDFRWIIAGAARSGSKWHVDPNCTHAWNCSLLGRKKWIMLPPWGAPPPGVFPSPDGGSVAQPVSLMEWFLEFYRTTRKTRESDLVEFIAGPGDLVFVPSGWWHAVLNIDESFAVTQNYVSTSNIARAFRFFEQKTDQISGLTRTLDGEGDRRSTFAGEFRAALPDEYLQIVEEKIKEPEAGSLVAWSALVPKREPTPECSLFSSSKAADGQAGAMTGFSFGFNFSPE